MTTDGSACFGVYAKTRNRWSRNSSGRLNASLRWLQVKEKFGGLRFYVNCRKEEAIRQRTGIAAQESFRTCEICGQPGTLREARRCIKTLCDEHNTPEHGGRGRHG